MTRRALRALFYLLPLALITNGASADNELPVACNLRGGGFALQRSGDCLQAGGHPKDAPGRGSYLVIPNVNRLRASAPPIATRGDTNGAPEPGLTAAERQAVERELAQMPTVSGSVGWKGFPRSRSGGQAGDQRGATGMRSCLCGNGMRVWSQPAAQMLVAYRQAAWCTMIAITGAVTGKESRCLRPRRPRIGDASASRGNDSARMVA